MLMKTPDLILFCKMSRLAAVIVVLLFNRSGYAYSPQMQQAKVRGPWEIVVTMGMDESELRYPVTVPDQNKPTKLKQTLPIMGTPVHLQLEEYLPDLAWTTTAVDDPDGGVVANLTITGKDLNQNILLVSDDPAKHSITSTVGSVALKKLYNSKASSGMIQKLAEPDSVGILTIRLDDLNIPLEYVVKSKDIINLPKSNYKLEVLEYMPHYSLDTQTKKVVNKSGKPVNPAIKVKFDDGTNAFEQWLWSRSSSPHTHNKLPFQVEFVDFDFAEMEGKYIIVVSPENERWLFFCVDGKKHIEKLKIKHPYPLANKDYAFSIEEVLSRAVIKTEWKNISENLAHPAIMTTIKHNDTEQQLLLELNKPGHYKTDSGTLVFLFKTQTQAHKAAQ